jgi:hypothetical protein
METWGFLLSEPGGVVGVSRAVKEANFLIRQRFPARKERGFSQEGWSFSGYLAGAAPCLGGSGADLHIKRLG